jgi:hypothetical protein
LLPVPENYVLDINLVKKLSKSRITGAKFHFKNSVVFCDHGLFQTLQKNTPPPPPPPPYLHSPSIDIHKIPPSRGDLKSKFFPPTPDIDT